MSNPNSLPPGFRFHPTDEELILHYLKNRAASTPCPVSIIAEVDIYKLDPWELPDKALFGDREWYFFSPRDRKYPNGVRPNRAAASGYWKATGTDKPITSGNQNIGVKKALVFYKGRPPKGIKTNWIMHEYRLAESQTTNTYRPMKLRDMSMRLDDWVLCRIYKKSNHALSAAAEQPIMYQERAREWETSGDAYMSSIVQQQDTPKLQKSSSLTDFLEDYTALSRLFDTMPETPAQQSVMGPPNATQPFASSGGNYLPQQLTGAPPAAESYLKRQRMVEDVNAGPSKKLSFTNTGSQSQSQFDGTSPQYSMMNQALLTQHQQQLLLNSHLGLH